MNKTDLNENNVRITISETIPIEELDVLIFNYSGFCSNPAFFEYLDDFDIREYNFLYDLRFLERKIINVIFKLKKPVGRIKYLIVPHSGSDSTYYQMNYNREKFPDNHYNNIKDGWKDYYYAVTRGCLELCAFKNDIKNIGFTHLGPMCYNMPLAMTEAIKYFASESTKNNHNYYFVGCGFTQNTVNNIKHILSNHHNCHIPIGSEIHNDRWVYEGLLKKKS